MSDWIVSAVLAGTSPFPIFPLPQDCTHCCRPEDFYDLDLPKLDLKKLVDLLEVNEAGSITFADIIRLTVKDTERIPDFGISRRLRIWTVLSVMVERHFESCLVLNRVSPISDREFLTSNNEQILDRAKFSFFISRTDSQIGNRALDPLMYMDIEDMGFSVRTSNCLSQKGITILKELLSYSEEELLDIRNFGSLSLTEVQKRLQQMGLELRPTFGSSSLNGRQPNVEFREMGFSTRTINSLNRVGAYTLEDLQLLTDKDLLDGRFLGQKTLKEVRGRLTEIGLALGQPITPPKLEPPDANDKDLNPLLVEDFCRIASRLGEFDLPIDFSKLRNQVSPESLSGMHQLEIALSTDTLSLKAALSALTLNRIDTIPVANCLNICLEIEDVWDECLLNRKSLINCKEAKRKLEEFGKGNYLLDQSLDGLTYLTILNISSVDHRDSLPKTLDELLLISETDLTFSEENGRLLDGISDFINKHYVFPNLAGVIVGLIGRGSDNDEDALNAVIDKYLNSINPNQKSFLMEIMIRRARGDTLDAIAADHDLTRERIRQLQNRLHPNFAEIISSIRGDLTSEWKDRFQAQAKEIFAAYGALYPDELERLFGMERTLVLESLPRHYRKLIFSDYAEPEDLSPHASTIWDKTATLETIRKASTYFFPLSAANYSRLVAMGEISGPSIPRIFQVFGSWKEACNLAGVEHATQTRPDYELLWTDKELVTFVARFLQDPGRGSGVSTYDKWKDSQLDRVPSSGTLRNQVGTWLDLKKYALEYLRTQRGKEVRYS